MRPPAGKQQLEATARMAPERYHLVGDDAQARRAVLTTELGLNKRRQVTTVDGPRHKLTRCRMVDMGLRQIVLGRHPLRKVIGAVSEGAHIARTHVEQVDRVLRRVRRSTRE